MKGMKGAQMSVSGPETGKLPSVSVVMPAWNAEKYIREAIDSILAQTMTDFEFIIVDDNSSDSTPQILAEYARRDPRVKTLRNEQNVGGGQSRNVGLAVARAPLFITPDADDMCVPERLAKQKEFLDTHPDIAAVFNSFTVVNADGEFVAVKEIRWNAATMSKLLHRRCVLGHHAGMYRADVFRGIGGYKAKLWLAQDWDMLIRLTSAAKIAVMREPLYKQRMHFSNTKARFRAIRPAYHAAVLQLDSDRKSGVAESSMNITVPEVPLDLQHGQEEQHYYWILTKIAIGEGEYRNAFRYLRLYSKTNRLKTFPRAMFILAAVPVRAFLQALGIVKWVERIFQGK